MIGWGTLTLMWIGVAFMLLAAVGILRLPDAFTRMQAATKAVTLGVSFMMVAAAVHFGDMGVSARALAIVVFLFATAPVAGHIIGRVAYIVGVELWHGTIADELRGVYEEKRRAEDAEPASPPAPRENREA